MSVHIGARAGDIAETVLLPGDPLRAKFVAETYLSDVRCVSTVRNMLGFTGTTTHGKRATVLGTGMGMPSISIFTHELINDYGARRLIRMGSCGSLQADINPRDIILAIGACSDSAMNLKRFKNMSFAPTADFELLLRTTQAAHKLDIPIRVGNILSTDMFYHEENPDHWKVWAQYGVLAAEMETAELYTIAAKKHVQALSVLTVSDSLVTQQHLTATEREKTFTDMMRLVLDVV